MASTFVQNVFELSRQVLVQSRTLADLINLESTTEETIISAAKQTASITSQFGECIVQNINVKEGTSTELYLPFVALFPAG